MICNMGSLRLKGCLLTAVFFSSCISLANMKFSIKKNTYLLFLGTRAFQGSERMLSWCDAMASQKCGQRYTLQTHRGLWEAVRWGEQLGQVVSRQALKRAVLCGAPGCRPGPWGFHVWGQGAHKWKQGPNRKFAGFQVCAYENMRIRQVTSESLSHLGLPGATTSFLYF